MIVQIYHISHAHGEIYRKKYKLRDRFVTVLNLKCELFRTYVHPPAFIDAESGLCFGLSGSCGGAKNTPQAEYLLLTLNFAIYHIWRTLCGEGEERCEFT
jgi:hypothetical protein